MSKSNLLLAAFGIVAVAAACAREQDEFVGANPGPISAEPAYTGKYN